MSAKSVPRGFRKKKKSKHNSDRDINDALKIDRTNTDRLDRILRHLDDPDPTGALFGIKTDQSWTDFVDEDMESAIRGPAMLNFIPPPKGVFKVLGVQGGVLQRDEGLGEEGRRGEEDEAAPEAGQRQRGERQLQ